MGCVHGKGCAHGKPGKSRSLWTWRQRSSADGSKAWDAAQDGEGTDSDADSEDKPTPLYAAAGADVGLRRLSRLSGQYLPPSGSRIASIPKFNYELKYSYLSQRGYYPEALDKANQDSFCIHTHFGTDANDHFFGVFDGHGEFGTQCSQFVKKHLCENLLKDRHFSTDIVQAYHSAFTTTNLQLHRHNIDDSMSGTTAITVLVRGKTLYVANVGDSRAVLAEKRGKELFAVDLSSDQTPFRSDECARVKQCGARVLTMDQLEGLKNPNVQCWGGEEDDGGDPPRLWFENGMYPGTAFTRSIGDKIAEKIGVVAVPEVLVMELTPDHPFFVLASDGVFEFLSSQQVVNMVAEHVDPSDACAQIVAESYRLWLHDGPRTDDITIIVVHVSGLSNENSWQENGDASSLKPYGEMSEFPVYELSPVSKGHWHREMRPVRHEISVARLRAIESTIHKGVREPVLQMHPKSEKDVEHIEKALQGNFLFNGLTEKQRRVLYDCMEKIDIQAGDVVIGQESEDNCFYIVASGEFEVLVSQGGDPGQDLSTVVNRYSADDFSCFGELALMYSKPRQSTVRAVKDGSLWSLRREVFRSVLSMKYSHESILKTLRTVDVLSHLTLSQLHRLSESVTDVSYRKGEMVIMKGDSVSSLYVIHQGEVKLTFYGDSASMGKDQEESSESQKIESLTSGSCFGEWVLMNKPHFEVTAEALTDVDCWVITKSKFEAVVGNLQDIIQEDLKLRERISNLRRTHAPQIDVEEFSHVKLSDLEWQSTIYATDCCEVGLVIKKQSNTVVSMKRYLKSKVKLLGREMQVLQEKALIRHLRPSLFVPQVISTCANKEHAAIVLNSCLVGPLSLVLSSPLDETSARFIAASAVLALDLLHKDGVVYRGISPDILMFDDKGWLQLVDFRFAKKLSNERTFTICGMADFLAPEIIKGQGHGFAADWWALGVLIYFMLQNELPFGSWRDSELDIFAKVARGQLLIPDRLSPEARDLLKKVHDWQGFFSSVILDLLVILLSFELLQLLVVDEEKRLGLEGGATSIKQHPWFAGLDWESMLECQVSVPKEIMTRLELALESHHLEESHITNCGTDLDDLNTPLWLEDW